MPSHLRIAFVGSWVPRRCGIATFTRDMRDAVRRSDPSTRCVVLAIDEPDADRVYDDSVIHRIHQHDAASYRDAASVAVASGAQIVSVQHEFGLYGTDRDGVYTDHLVGFLDALRIPAITTLHTVLPHPAPWMRDVVRTIAERSAAVVVMANTAAHILTEVYGVARRPIVIPHGVPTVAPTIAGRDAAKRRLGLDGHPVISTFGLVDPRKGIEYAIDAMASVVARHPAAVYVVAGQTHPELIKHQGESYRRELEARVERLGLKNHVRFINEYLTLDRIVEVLEATDAYVTPYLDPNQITSGTLAYALGAGRAVVSTPYLHAAEALGSGRGLLADFHSSEQLADALLAILDQPLLKAELEGRAYAYGRESAWAAVGARTIELMSQLVADPPRPRFRLQPPLLSPSRGNSAA